MDKIGKDSQPNKKNKKRDKDEKKRKDKEGIKGKDNRGTTITAFKTEWTSKVHILELIEVLLRSVYTIVANVVTQSYRHIKIMLMLTSFSVSATTCVHLIESSIATVEAIIHGVQA